MRLAKTQILALFCSADLKSSMDIPPSLQTFFDFRGRNCTGCFIITWQELEDFRHWVLFCAYSVASMPVCHRVRELGKLPWARLHIPGLLSWGRLLCIPVLPHGNGWFIIIKYPSGNRILLSIDWKDAQVVCDTLLETLTR